MISWMQKHNKYLVITIWIATIAFIGAGAVGWGSMSFGSSANSVGKVGDIYISKTKYAFTYNNLYQRYAQQFGQQFDRKKAKELGLEKIAFNNLANEALLLNMANEYGIIVSDKEVAKEIESYKLFQGKDGTIDKTIYDNFVRSRGITKKDFEDILRDQLKVRKLLTLIDIKPLDFEKEVAKSTFMIGDKLKYKVITSKDIKVNISDDEVKSFWQKNKDKYKTVTKYKLSLLWTKSDNVSVSNDELKKYYNANSFKFTDAKGKIKDFNSSKEAVIEAVKLEKIKKNAALDRSRFKKSKMKATEVVTLNKFDKKLTKDIWNKILSSKEGAFLKPKAIKDSYVTVHIDKVIAPRVMSFEEAKELAKADLQKQKSLDELNKVASNLLKDTSKLDNQTKDFISLSKFDILNPLTPQESAEVIKRVFANDKKSAAINLDNSVFVYEVKEQKILDNNSSLSTLDQEVKQIKSGELTYNLIKKLSSKYQIQSYIKDNK